MNPDPTRTRIISPSHSIEVGTSTWDPAETSIRSRYDGPTGRFDPHGSSELPLPDLPHLMDVAATYDLIDPKEYAAIIEALAASIHRQLP